MSTPSPTPERAASDPLKNAGKDAYDDWFSDSPDIFKALANLQYGADRTLAFAVETRVLLADPKQYPDLEKKLLGLLKDAREDAARTTICRLLSYIGTEESVPVVGPLLANPKTADDARLALEPIPGDAVSTAFRNALPKLSGDALAGLIGSIAVRGDTSAVPAIKQIAAAPGQSPVVRTTAERALKALQS